MKYQSELIKEIVDTRGHKLSSIHYESECVKSWIEEAEGAYPKLCDYESEWLKYISILDDTGGSEDPEPPIGEFPYVVLSDVTEATIDNVVPLAYKSAILKGKTDENLQSVRNPVLTTTGKNLLDPNSVELVVENGNSAQTVTYDSATDTYEFLCPKSANQMNIKFKNLYGITSPNQVYISGTYESEGAAYEIGRGVGVNDNVISIQIVRNWKPITKANIKIMITIDNNATTSAYEPFKSNILTVNEDVELRGIGEVKDELDLLTGKLTQRIGENNEVLAQEVVKTVDLTITNQDGETLNKLKPIEGTMHLSTSSNTINPLFSGEIPVEAITQNLASFIDLETEE